MTLLYAFASNAWIAKMMRFVDDDHVSVCQRAFHVPRPPAFALQIGVIVNDNADKAAVKSGQQFLDNRFPNILAGRLRCEQHDAFAFAENETLDEHQTHVGFTKADAIAEERATVACGDADKVLVGIALLSTMKRDPGEVA